MTKKFIVLFLLLLLPVMIWAQNSVTFDFSSPSQEVQNTIEKDDIVLKFSVRPGSESKPDEIIRRKSSCLSFSYNGLLTIEGKNCEITSIVFYVSDQRHSLKKYDNEGKMNGKTIDKKEYKQVWKGEADRVSFVPVNSGSVEIKTIQVSYEKAQPKDVSLAVSSAERATLYYSDRSFIIPEGVVARTYKIEGNVLSRSREYKKGDVLPKATAVVLEAKEGKYIFEETSKAGETDPYNALRGSDTKTTTSGGEVYYVFGKGSNGVGFYWKKANGKAFTTEAHKAYLVYTPSKTTNAKSFLGFDVALEIQGPTMREKVTFDGPIYNLAGQRVDKDYKGIIIVNGKKYLNR